MALHLTNVKFQLLVSRQEKMKRRATLLQNGRAPSLPPLSHRITPLQSRLLPAFSLHIFYVISVVCYLITHTQCCYVYPPDVKDPCRKKDCSFGALCVPSLDGLIARCQCPDRCDKYGDSAGSTPICGNDGKDYANVCEMRRAACRDMKEIAMKYPGKCGKSLFA